MHSKGLLSFGVHFYSAGKITYQLSLDLEVSAERVVHRFVLLIVNGFTFISACRKRW